MKLLVSFLANVGAAINFSAVEVAVLLMDRGSTLEESAWAMSVLDSLVFVGCIVGMLAFGFVGDLFGRLRSLRATMGLAIMGVCLSFAPFDAPARLEITLCCSRFLVGVGTGGIYPLSAAIAYERGSSSAEESIGPELSVALSNFGQPIGCCLLFVVALAFVLSDSFTSQAKWRFVLFLGALPFIAASLLTLRLDDDHDHRDENKKKPLFKGGEKVQQDIEEPSLAELIITRRDVRRAVVGAGGTWFVYNVYSYGVVTYYPQLASSIVGHDNVAVLAANVTASAAAVAAAGLSLILIDRYGARQSILLGCASGAAYCAALLVVHRVAGVGPVHKSFALWLFIILRGFIQLPGIGVFTLPNTIFATRVRSRAQGLSAAIGKVGAIVGSALFPAIFRRGGLSLILAVTATLFVVDGIVCASSFRKTKGQRRDASCFTLYGGLKKHKTTVLVPGVTILRRDSTDDDKFDEVDPLLAVDSSLR